jgi:hypothetical protein
VIAFGSVDISNFLFFENVCLEREKEQERCFVANINSSVRGGR